jgi:phosphomannomutase
MEMSSSLRISHVGLRGIVGGGGITAAHVLDFCAAFGSFVQCPGRVVIGRDPRASGAMLREGVIAGLLATGHDVADLGVVSTPVIQHAIRRLDAAGGISIGASHNAVEWNALKFFGPRGTYLTTSEAGELLDIYHLKRFSFVEWEQIGKLRHEDGAVDLYLDELASVFDFAPLKRFRVLVDCTSGTSASILRRLNERYGFAFILINERQDGRAFAHEPATNRRMVELQLAPLVPHVGADAGFLFDIDSDRVALATETGAAISEEMVLPILADDLLQRGPGKLILTNLSTTALLEEIAARHGGKVIRVPVGRQATTDALGAYRPEQIAVAGEGTGAVMMPQFRFVYDGIATMLAVLSILDRRGMKLSEIVETYPKYSILKGEIPLETHRIPEMLIELESRYSDGRRNTQDGLRVDWPGKWFHVRVSQTEPIVRILCEQRGEPPRDLYNELMEFIRSYVA